VDLVGRDQCAGLTELSKTKKIAPRCFGADQEVCLVVFSRGLENRLPLLKKKTRDLFRYKHCWAGKSGKGSVVRNGTEMMGPGFEHPFFWSGFVIFGDYR
jgi:CHAT domain-containing protein